MDKARGMLDEFWSHKTVQGLKGIQQFMGVILYTKGVFTSEARNAEFRTLVEAFDQFSSTMKKSSWGRNEFYGFWNQACKELWGDPEKFRQDYLRTPQTTADEVPWYQHPAAPGHPQTPQPGKRAPLTGVAVTLDERERSMQRTAILEEMKLHHNRMAQLIAMWEAVNE